VRRGGCVKEGRSGISEGCVRGKGVEEKAWLKIMNESLEF